jgi:hypothetical protein
MSSGGIARARVLDIYEDLAGPFAGGGAPGSMTDPRPLYQQGNDGLNLASMYLSGGSSLPVPVTRNGHGARRYAPGTAQNSTAAMLYSFPLGRNLSLIPLAIRRNFRWVWETVLERTTPLIAGARCDIGLKDDITITENGGIYLTSVSTVNAGRWTRNYHLTNAGALQTALDTGVAPGTGLLQHIKFEYFDRFPEPRLNIYIDGVLVASHSGATLPAFDGNEPLNPCIVVDSPTIGQQDHQYMTRFYIEEL